MSEEEKGSGEDYEMEDEDEDNSSDSSSTTSSPSSSSETSSTSDSETLDDEESENETQTPSKGRRTRGRWKLFNEKKAFKKEWCDIYEWAGEHPSDPKLAICNRCYCTMKAQKNILDTHQRSKKHLRNTGMLVDDEPRKEPQSSIAKAAPEQQPFPKTDPTIPMEEQVSFFTESPADAAHQAVTSLIDKLVEKYHDRRLLNLKIQNKAVLSIETERAKSKRSANDRKSEQRLQKESYLREAEETSLKLLHLQHEAKINAMEEEKDAKLKAVEQELVFAKQEYEKKVKLLDSQLSSMK